MNLLSKYYSSKPSKQIIAQLDVDLFGLIHFSVNTFTNKEWGYGNPEDAQLFNPVEFDAEQIVSTARDGGLKGIILVCKHHDGFCLWPTKTTSHNISNCPWRDGKGPRGQSKGRWRPCRICAKARGCGWIRSHLMHLSIDREGKTGYQTIFSFARRCRRGDRDRRHAE